MSRNLTLVIHALHGGGAERVAANMANQWAAQGDVVTLVTLDSRATDVFPLDPAVVRMGLGWMRHSANTPQAVCNNARRLLALRRALRAADPDCVVSLTDQINVLTLLASRGLSVPVVIAEHSDPRQQRMSGMWEQLRRWAYPRCAAAVALTGAVADHLRTLVRSRPVFVIPNAIGKPCVMARNSAGRDEHGIVALGRLSPEKGFDLLIEAFARVARRHPAWRLEIAGEGPQRERLQTQVTRCGLQDRVRLAGWVDDPARFLARGAIFVMSSRYEGFPMALLEAMACGVPAISFDCESGPRDIIRPEVDGVLVPAGDVAALSGAMERLIADPVTRERFGVRGEEVTDRFSTETHRQRWNAVLDRCRQG